MIRGQLMTDEIPLRMLGENITLTRSQWLSLLNELRVHSDLARRIRARLEEATLWTTQREKAA